MMYNYSLALACPFYPFRFEYGPILISILDHAKQGGRDQIQSYCCIHRIDKRCDHKDEEYIHKSHHLAHIRCFLSWYRRRSRFGKSGEFRLEIRKHSCDDGKNDIFGGEKIHAQEVMVDIGRIEILYSEPVEEAIQPFRRDLIHGNLSDDIIQSDEYRDLDKHHETAFESSFPICFEDLHGFF